MTAALVPGGKASPMWRRPDVLMRALVCVILCAATRRLGKIYFVAGHECYYCKQWVEEGEPHDCWNKAEAALTCHLSDDLRESWGRLRETAVSFSEQRTYASHHSIICSRKTCYFFVRPEQKYLELCVFLGAVAGADPGSISRRQCKVGGGTQLQLATPEAA